MCEHKREGESFTETILRLTGAGDDPLEGFGAMRDVGGFREAVESTHDELNADLPGRRGR